MRESEIQSLHTLIFCTHNVLILFLLRQCVPLPVLDLVAPDVEGLDQVEEHDVEAADT
jgi:hypothetical protein